MSPTSYRTAPPRVMPGNSNCNTRKRIATPRGVESRLSSPAAAAEHTDHVRQNEHRGGGPGGMDPSAARRNRRRDQQIDQNKYDKACRLNRIVGSSAESAVRL